MYSNLFLSFPAPLFSSVENLLSLKTYFLAIIKQAKDDNFRETYFLNFMLSSCYRVLFNLNQINIDVLANKTKQSPVILSTNIKVDFYKKDDGNIFLFSNKRGLPRLI